MIRSIGNRSFLQGSKQRSAKEWAKQVVPDQNIQSWVMRNFGGQIFRRDATTTYLRKLIFNIFHLNWEQKEPVKEEQAEKKEEPAKEKRLEQTEEIVLKVDKHCPGCAKKVKKSLLRIEGVENVTADSRSKTVVVKSRTADSAKVCERVERKTKRRIELVSPLPPPPLEEEKEDEAPPPPPEEKKEEPPKTITVILKVQMHCDPCAQLLQKRISRIDGVESVATDVPNDQVIVKGVVEPTVLVESIQRKTGRPAAIIEDDKKLEEETKPEEEKKKPEVEKKGDEEEVKQYEFWPPVRYHVEYVYPYPPAPVEDEFSDENPNACAIV